MPGLGLHSGLDFEQMSCLQQIAGVANRMQLAGIYQGAAIYVDYAHARCVVGGTFVRAPTCDR